MALSQITKLTSDFFWQFFEIKKNSEDSSDLSKVKCLKCEIIISRGPDSSKWGIFPLKWHFQTKHQIESDGLAEYLEQRMPNLSNTPSTKRKAESWS